MTTLTTAGKALGNEPAYPCKLDTGEGDVDCPGLTKREAFASQAMSSSAMASNDGIHRGAVLSSVVAEAALERADALLNLLAGEP